MTTGPFPTIVYGQGGNEQYYPVPVPAAGPLARIAPDTIAIGGRQFTVNTSFEPYRREAFRHRTILPQRQSINFENVAGYGTLNTEGLWRRDQLDWSEGAGQQFLDRKTTSSASRYLYSKGVNPWVENQLTLLNDTASRYSSSNSNVKAVAAGNYVYILDGNTVKYYTASLPSSWPSSSTSVTGLTGTLNDICSDGAYVYVASTTGIWKIDASAAPSTATNYVGVGAITNYTIVATGFTAPSKATNFLQFPTSSGSLPSSIQVGLKITASTASAGLVGLVITGISPNGISISSPTNGSSIQSNDTITFQVQYGYTVASFTKVWVCNNTVMAAAKASTGGSNCLFGFVNAPTASAAPDASAVLMVHPNANFNWTCATGGMTQIYCGGYVNNGAASQGVVYRSAMVGSTANSSVNQPFDLNYPVQTLPFEVGEYPTCLYSYLNFIFVGTNLGIRMCQTLSVYDPSATQTGDLKAGPYAPNLLQPLSNPVRGIVGDGRFVYFSWSNYDAISTGIGRMDLTTSIGGDPLSLAYASDLMVTGSGEVTWLDVDPFTNTPMMSIAGKGVYSAASTFVASGTINSGAITYGISDDKIPVKIDLSANLDSSTGVGVNINLFSPTGSDINVSPGQYTGTELAVPGGFRSERLNVTLTLTSNTAQTATPTLYRYTLKVWPAVVSETQITPVVSFYKRNLSGAQVEYSDPYDNYAYLLQLLQSQSIVQYREGPLTANVVVSELDWLPHKVADNYEQGFVGDCVIYLKTIGGIQYTAAATQ
jgi:hypothetical protein